MNIDSMRSIVDVFKFSSIRPVYRNISTNIIVIVKSKKSESTINKDFIRYKSYLDNVREALTKITFPLFERIQPSFNFYNSQFLTFIGKIKNHTDKRAILDNFYMFFYLYMYHMHGINHIFYHKNIKMVRDNFGIALTVDAEDAHKPKLICAIDSQKLQLFKMILVNSNDRHFYNPDHTSPAVMNNFRFDDKMITANLLIIHLLERLIQAELVSYFHNFRHEKYYFAAQLVSGTPNIDINKFIVK